jgi:D-psicose/D-tagatose/L-ribulose 3-epimerase
LQRLAASVGTTLGLEPCKAASHISSTEVADALKRVGDPNAGACHASIEKRNFSAALADGRGHVRHVHLSESDCGVPGSANVCWKELFDALKRSNFSGDLVGKSFVNAMPQPARALSYGAPRRKTARKIWRSAYPS